MQQKAMDEMEQQGDAKRMRAEASVLPLTEVRAVPPDFAAIVVAKNKPDKVHQRHKAVLSTCGCTHKEGLEGKCTIKFCEGAPPCEDFFELFLQNAHDNHPELDNMEDALAMLHLAARFDFSKLTTWAMKHVADHIKTEDFARVVGSAKQHLGKIDSDNICDMVAGKCCDDIRAVHLNEAMVSDNGWGEHGWFEILLAMAKGWGEEDGWFENLSAGAKKHAPRRRCELSRLIAQFCIQTWNAEHC